MSKISEVGHPKNVANWQQLTSSVISFGPVYNPSRAAIQIPNLQQIGTEAQNSMTVLNAAKAEYKNASADRAETFELLTPLTSRAMNAIKSSATIIKVDDNAKTLVRKIQGNRAKAKTTPDTQALTTEGSIAKEISTSQMSFDNRIANFDELIAYFESVPEYAPNEEELKTVSLRNFSSNLKAKNDRAINATVAFKNARSARNKILYTPLTGLVDLSVDVKNYVKSAFGVNSPESKQLSTLTFRKFVN